MALRTWVSRIDGSTGLQDRLKFVWLGRAKGVIAISQRVREQCWPPAKVIGNPYRSELFEIRPDVSRHRDFVFLGRLVSDKGADLAIQALHRLSDQSHRNQDLTLTIIGDGPERAALEDLAAQLSIGGQVQFTGNLRGDALVDCINQHRFLWVPSRWEEPFGNVALEGMACGCIPIVSDGGGLPDAVGDAGLTFKRGDLSDMVEQSLRLLENEDLRQQLASAAADHLKRRVPQKVAERYLEVIEAAVAK
ncbi:glycosyltransferase family 4 protein [Rhodopirellula bahusiensis]|uniref:glycosyltransferase family 4 protein n=1 Tax=Rhodopirellula bahusiensis TaxID=2014065 RepID=UPI00329906D4